MKKSLIAVAGASVAAAAMPVMGVFAATTSTSFTDVVTVNVGSSCTVIPKDGTIVKRDTTDPQTGDRVIELEDRSWGPYSLMQGHVISNLGGSNMAEDKAEAEDGSDDATDDSGAVEVVCSNGAGTQAPGDGAAQNANSWKLTAVGLDSANMIGSGTAANETIATGDWSGTASQWQYKVLGTDVNTYSQIPTSATVIAKSPATGGSLTVRPRYRVRASATQTEGTYTGKVTYTLIFAE